MRKAVVYFIVVSFLVLGVQPLRAQYPAIPADVQRWSDSLLKAANRHSDSAWNIAYPIIKEAAKPGKPFSPWASRP